MIKHPGEFVRQLLAYTHIRIQQAQRQMIRGGAHTEHFHILSSGAGTHVPRPFLRERQSAQ